MFLTEHGGVRFSRHGVCTSRRYRRRDGRTHAGRAGGGAGWPPVVVGNGDGRRRRRICESVACLPGEQLGTSTQFAAASAAGGNGAKRGAVAAVVVAS